MNDKHFYTSLIKTIEKAVARSGRSARNISWRTAGHDNVLKDLRAGHIPKVDRLYELCNELGLDFYIGAPIRLGDFASAPMLGSVENDGSVVLTDPQWRPCESVENWGYFTISGNGLSPFYLKKNRLYCSLKMLPSSCLPNYENHDCIIHTSKNLTQLGIIKNCSTDTCHLESVAPPYPNIMNIKVQWFLPIINIVRNIKKNQNSQN